MASVQREFNEKISEINSEHAVKTNALILELSGPNSDQSLVSHLENAQHELINLKSGCERNAGLILSAETYLSAQISSTKLN